MLHYNYRGKLFMKNSLILVMWIWRGKELQPFPSLYSPFLHFFIFQPSIDSLPSTYLCSPSLTTLPSSYLPCPFRSSYIPPSVSTFPFPSFPYFSSSLPIYFSSYLLPYLSLSLPIYFASFPLSTFSAFPILPFSLFSAVTLFLSFYPSLFHFTPPFFPLFLSPFLFTFRSPFPSLFPSLPLLWVLDFLLWILHTPVLNLCFFLFNYFIWISFCINSCIFRFSIFIFVYLS